MRDAITDKTGHVWTRAEWYFMISTSRASSGNKRQKRKLYMCCWDLIEDRRKEILDKIHEREIREWMD